MQAKVRGNMVRISRVPDGDDDLFCVRGLLARRVTSASPLIVSGIAIANFQSELLLFVSNKCSNHLVKVFEFSENFRSNFSNRGGKSCQMI